MTLAVAAVMVLMMATWIKGSFILNSRARKREIPLERFIRDYKTLYPKVNRAHGTAVFFATDPNRTPTSLMQNIRHNKVLHEKNIILNVKIESVPYIGEEGRAMITHLNHEFSVVLLRFGFQEYPDVQEQLIKLNKTPDSGIKFDWEEISLFLSRHVLKANPHYGLPSWQDTIYIWMSKHAAEPTDFYKLPVGRVIEIGKQALI